MKFELFPLTVPPHLHLDGLEVAAALAPGTLVFQLAGRLQQEAADWFPDSGKRLIGI
jgi:hypothetical protein